MLNSTRFAGNKTKSRDFLDNMKHTASLHTQMNKYQQTPLMVAAGIGNLSLVKQLVEELQVDLEEKDKHGWSALTYAAAMKQVPVVKYLLSKGARIEVQSDEVLHAFINTLRHIWPLKHQ